MGKLVDKGLLLLLSAILLSFRFFPLPGIVVLLAAATVAALSGFCASPRLSGALFLGYLLLCLRVPAFCLGLPLVIYDSAPLCKNYLPFAALPVFLVSVSAFSIQEAAFCAVLCLGSVLLCHRCLRFEHSQATLYTLRDESHERLQSLKQRNEDLLERQDYEVQIAILHERNRIAREIHDNVGHMLSRSILQTGALLAVNEAPEVTEGLNNLKGTLDSAMNSIRTSVHDLYEESIRMEECLRRIQKEYTFCPIQLVYDVEHELPQGLTYAFLSIIREALSNTARHSDATQVTVTLREHPALFQLVIQDNGSPQRRNTAPGIGLAGMEERVRAFHGTMTVEYRGGFRVFLSIPKKAEKEEPA